MPASVLPTDRRFRQGGWLFLGTLLVFFLSSLLLYGIYASSRLGDVQSSVPLPNSFLTSTVLLLGISALVHWSTRSVRRSKRVLTASLLAFSAIAAVAFMAIQYVAMLGLLGGPAMQGGTGKGVAGMVVVLAFLHALHVAGGVIALGIVSVRSMLGKYDHERHWPVDFAAQYWHFLDLVWLCMLATFVATTGGFSGITLQAACMDGNARRRFPHLRSFIVAAKVSLVVLRTTSNYVADRGPRSAMWQASESLCLLG